MRGSLLKKKRYCRHNVTSINVLNSRDMAPSIKNVCKKRKTELLNLHSDRVAWGCLIFVIQNYPNVRFSPKLLQLTKCFAHFTSISMPFYKNCGQNHLKRSLIRVLTVAEPSEVL